jgi:hypothetical protein
MSTKDRTARSYADITGADLAKLAEIARADRNDFISRHPKYRARILLVALCQGAARHYLDRKTGVKDFDVWTFYAKEDSKHAYHPLRHAQADFGPSKFGSGADVRFVGRHVDLLGRTIGNSGGPVESVREWLRRGKRGSSPWHLAKKAVVVLEPARLRGWVVWPESGMI